MVAISTSMYVCFFSAELWGKYISIYIGMSQVLIQATQEIPYVLFFFFFPFSLLFCIF